MKNIIKRGTSLLLVVAMLLSFAVVVGAEPADATNTAVSGTFLKLRAEMVPLEAGKTANVKIFADLDDRYGIGQLNFNIYTDAGISIKQVNVNTKIGVKTGKNELNGIDLITWMSETPLGWDTDMDTNLTIKEKSVQLATLVLEATSDVPLGGYEVHFAPFDNGKEADKTDDVFSIIETTDKSLNISEGFNSFTIDNAEVEDGAAIVYDPQNLPMVALTKTTFDVPTMAEQEADVTKGNYELPKLLKIVARDSTSGEVKLYNVYNNWTAFTFEKIEGPAIDSNGTLKVTAKSTDGAASAKVTAYAADADGNKIDSIQVNEQTISYTIRKTETGLWKASFADSKDSYLSAQGFIDKEAKGGEVSAPAQTVDTPKSVSLNPKVFDKYGDIYTGPEAVTATATVELYSKNTYQEADKITDYTSYVYIDGKSLKISKELPTDVYCKLTLDVEGDAKPGTMTVAEFLIKSTKPRATSAEIVLKDVKGNQYTDSQGKPLYIFTIPAPGQNPVQITIDATVYDQKNGVMDGVTYTVKAYLGTKDSGGTEIKAPGEVEKASATLENGVLTITSEALSLLNPTTGAGATITVEIAVNGISDKITQEIKLVKAQPVATKLATKNGEWKDGRILPMAFSDMPLPGIGKTSETPFTFLRLSVLDQYDTEMTEVTYDHFALYPAVEATDGDVSNGSNTFKKTGDPAISSTYAIFAANSNGVKLEITNAWDATKNQLAVPDGYYIVEATYPNPDDVNQPLVARCVIKLTKAPVPTTATVEASAETIYVPYASEYGTLGEGKSSEVTLRATVKDQYGDPITEGVTLAKVGDTIDLYDSNNTHVLNFDNRGTAAYVTNNTTDGTVQIKVSKDLAELMVKKDKMVVRDGELRLPLKVTVGEGANAKEFTTTAKVKVSREASALKKATVVMKQGETVVQTVTLTDESSSTQQQTINMTSPKAGTNYTFEIAYEDQYGDDTTVSYISGVNDTLTADDTVWGPYSEKKQATLTVKKDNVNGKTMLEIKPLDGPTWWLSIKFAPMQFFKDVNGEKKTYEISDMLNLETERTYGELDSSSQPITTWASFLAAMTVQDAKTVYVQKDGTSYDQVNGENLRVVIKDEAGKTVFDVLDQTITSSKANAGTYKIHLVYTDTANNAQYEVCTPGTLTINKKPITIGLKANETITKEYDGTKNLPDDAANKLELTGKVGNDDVSIKDENLVFASKDVNASVGSETNAIVIGDVNIVAAKGSDENDLSVLKGDDADNYTASIAGLKGTITQKALNVTLKLGNKAWDGTDSGLTINHVESATIGTTIAESGVTVKVTELSGAKFSGTNAGSYLESIGNLSVAFEINGVKTYNYTQGTVTYNSGNNNDAAKIVKATFTLNAADVPTSYIYGSDDTALAIDPAKLKLADGTSPVATSVVDYIKQKTEKPSLFPNSATTSASGHYKAGRNYPVSVSIPAEDQGNYEIVLNPTGLTITIEQYELRVAPNNMAIEKTYDGKTMLPENAEFDVVGSVSGETLNFDRTKLHFESADAGQGKKIVADAGFLASVTNGDVANYKVTMGGQMSGTIEQKAITADMFTQKSDHPVYDGTEQTLTGKDLVGTDSTITDANGNPKSLQPGTDFTAVDVTETNAGTYKMTVSGKGNYKEDVSVQVPVTIDKFVATSQKPLFSTSISSVKVTRGKTTILYIDTAVLLKDGELGESGAQVDGKVTWTVERSTPGAAVTVERVEKQQKKLKVTVEVPNGATPDENNPQIIITLRSNFAESHQNITSGQSRTYNLYVTDKEQQDKFEIVQGESGTYSYSQGGVQLTTSGSATGSAVTWSISDADKDYAKVNADGYVTFLKPTTTGVIITATASETDDYAAASDTYTLTITKGQVTVSASSATMTANAPLPGFSATASGLNPKDSVSDVFQTLTATVSTDGKTAGTYRVTPNAVFKAGWDAYYDLYFVPGTLTVNPATTVIDTILPTIIAGNGCANSYADCSCEIFYDLDASRWYHEAIDWAYSLGLMNGTTKSTFGPNAAATRAQTWTMLARIAGQDTRRSSTWYEVGQKWAMNLGITDGTNPMGSLTREQLAAMLYRYVGSPAVNGTLTFTDSANVSTWARNAMIWAVQNGILDGVGGNRLNPKGTTTRAQAAAIFMRFSKLINK